VAVSLAGAKRVAGMMARESVRDRVLSIGNSNALSGHSER
jgi:hypothetical protein